MIEYFLKDENGNPVKRSDITKIRELDKIFLERNNSIEKNNSREFPVNGGRVCIFYRDKGYSRVIISEHEADTKREFESRTNLKLEELKCQ